MSIIFNLIYRFNAIPIRISASYFVDMDKLILNFMWRGKRPRRANTIFKEHKVGELSLPNFKIYYKESRRCGISKRTNRSREQSKETHIKKVNGSLIKEQRQYDEEETVSSTNGAVKLGIPVQKNKSRQRPYTLCKN